MTDLGAGAGLYDAADSKRFFISISFFSCRTAACLAKGAVPIFSYLLIGVSKTSDPREGFLGPYFVATDGINPDTNKANFKSILRAMQVSGFQE